MIYFIDTEFVDDGQSVMPISLAIVPLDERRRELYLELVFDEDRANADDFVRERVLPHLRGQERYDPAHAARMILSYFGLPRQHGESKEKIEMWSWYSGYDWVLFCQLFGGMCRMPGGLPPICFDLAQRYFLDNRSMEVNLPPKPTNAHDALADARWHREIYLRLTKDDDVRYPKQAHEEGENEPCKD